VVTVVRNIVLIGTATALAAGGALIGVGVQPVVTPSGNTPGSPSSAFFPPGTEVAFGASNRIPPPVVTTTPISTFVNYNSTAPLASVPAVPANYASLAASDLQSWVDSSRAGGAGLLVGSLAPLTYDPRLGTVAANLIADSIATNLTSAPVLNSQGQTPIQQVQTQFPGTKATAAGLLSARYVIGTAADASAPFTLGLGGVLAGGPIGTIEMFWVGSIGSTGITMLNNTGWTHYGIAVVVTPAVPNQSDAVLWAVVIFAKEG